MRNCPKKQIDCFFLPNHRVSMNHPRLIFPIMHQMRHAETGLQEDRQMRISRNLLGILLIGISAIV